MYGIDGRRDLPERELPHLEGYRGSAPVRVGNAAVDQLQLDIYGALIDSIYLYDKWGQPISSDHWDERLRRWSTGSATHWDQPDEGIWETRGGRKNFLYSRLMCWVAIERAMRMANQPRPARRPAALAASPRRDLPADHAPRLVAERRQAFVQHEDGDVLDASVLMMPLAKFISPTDPQVARPPWTRSARTWSPTRWSTATTRRPAPTACAARRAPSRSAPSGTSRP